MCRMIRMIHLNKRLEANMAYCQKCKTEYREGYSRCSDCDMDLVENLVEEDLIEESLEDHNNALISKLMNDSPEFLITAVDVIDAELIESFLGTNNIPVLKKFRESGDYLTILMGNTNLGIDMYVPSKLFDEAKILLEAKPELNFAQELDHECEIENENEYEDEVEDEVEEEETGVETGVETEKSGEKAIKENQEKHDGFWKRIFK